MGLSTNQHQPDHQEQELELTRAFPKIPPGAKKSRRGTARKRRLPDPGMAPVLSPSAERPLPGARLCKLCGSRLALTHRFA